MPLSFPINLKNIVSEVSIPAYITINGFCEGIGVEFKRKSNTTLVVLLSNCPKILKKCYD